MGMSAYMCQFQAPPGGRALHLFMCQGRHEPSWAHLFAHLLCPSTDVWCCGNACSCLLCSSATLCIPHMPVYTPAMIQHQHVGARAGPGHMSTQRCSHVHRCPAAAPGSAGPPFILPCPGTGALCDGLVRHASLHPCHAPHTPECGLGLPVPKLV